MRVVAGAAAAALLVLAVPAPASAAPTPKVTITDVAVTEGTGAAVNASFTIQVAPRPGVCCALQVSWATAPGSASAPADFTSSSGTISLTKTAFSRVVSVPVIGDASDEPNETFVVNLSNLTGSPGSIADAQGIATITDDDSPPLLSVNDVSVTEGNAGTTTATFTASLSAASANAVTFNWTTAPGSATAGVDYVAASGSRTITAGTTTSTIGITVNGDVLAEGNEDFGITLSGPSNATIGDGSGLATITDDEPLPALSVNDVSVTEGNAGPTTATFTVALSPAVANAVTFDWTTTAGSATAGVDYVAATGSPTIAAGATSTTFGVTVNGDLMDEVEETFGITLSNPGNATIGDGSGLGTITDDDLPPLLSVDDVSVSEGNAGTTTATFTASLSTASGNAVTFSWTTAAGSATSGVDYVVASGGGTIAAGSTSTTIDVTVNGDALDEADETFGITLSTPGNATIGDGSGFGTITDDDPLPVLAVGDASVTEGIAGTASITFDVTLSSASGKTVTVDWATGDDGAIQPGDYATGAGTLTFVPGDTSESIVVTVNGDGTAELDESFLITLSAPGNATIGDGSGLGTIVDDELLSVIDIDEPTVVEGQSGTGTVSFSVILSHPAVFPVTVDWSTAAGTAASGTDYLGASGTVTFAPMDISETVLITVYGDTTYERGETLMLELSNGLGAPIGDVRGIGTIANDDAAPVVSVTNDSVVEGNSGTSVLTFAVSLTGASSVDASIDFTTAAASATAGTDFVSASGTLTIPGGATSGTVNVVVNGDAAFESNETLSLTLSNPADATIGDGIAQGTIVNDDKMPTTLTLKVVRKPRAVMATGILEPTKSGHRVTATLFRKQGTKFVKITAKTVRVRYFKDRDGDGKKDGSYTATFLRPKAQGTYKVLVRFNGTSTHKPSSRLKVFTLPAS